jgi:hypothetical protein
MQKIIDLLGKTVKFIHTENGHIFEQQGKITDVILNIDGKHHISLEDECYLLESLLEFEII